MKPKVIHTEVDYEAALQRIDALMESDPDPASPEGQELELFTLLVERYEEGKYPMDLPTPVAAIQFRMKQQGLKSKDLIPFIGSASKVSEVLSGHEGKPADLPQRHCHSRVFEPTGPVELSRCRPETGR